MVTSPNNNNYYYYWQVAMVTCLYSVHQWPVISIFAPVGKTVGLKSDSYLLELSQSPLSLCKLWGGEIKLCASAVGAKIWYFLFVVLGLPVRGAHSLNKYCVVVYGWILMAVFAFLRK